MTESKQREAFYREDQRLHHQLLTPTPTPTACAVELEAVGEDTVL
jgi:hypothetical protein